MNHKYEQNYRLSKEERRDRGYIKGPRLSLHPPLLQVQRQLSEVDLVIGLHNPLSYELMKLDLHEQQEQGCGWDSGRCHHIRDDARRRCVNCPNWSKDQPVLDFKCQSEQERLARLEERANDMQGVVRSTHDDAYLAHHVPPEAHGLMHGYRTNLNIIRSAIGYLAEAGLIKDFLIRKHGLADVPAHLAQQYIQRKISEILKDKEDEENS